MARSKLTDLEKAQKLFAEFGYEEVPCSGLSLGSRQYSITHTKANRVEMTFGDGTTDEFKGGYAMFGFCLCFDDDGKYLGHGAFE